MTDNMIGRVPPHSREAEEAVISGILLKPSKLDEVSEVLLPNHFYDIKHREIFKAMLTVAEKGDQPDLVTLMDTVDHSIVNPVFLAEVVDHRVLTSQIMSHAEIVRRDWQRREIIQMAGSAAREAWDAGCDPVALVEDFYSNASDITASRIDAVAPAVDIVDGVLGNIAKRRESKFIVTGCPTGYSDMDYLTSGLQPSEYIILAARPSMGKSALSAGMALRIAAREKVPTLFYSLEMSKESLVERLISVASRVPLTQIKRGMLTDAEAADIEWAGEFIKAAPLYFDDTSGLTTQELKARTKKWVKRAGIKLVVIDYLQLMRAVPRPKSREQEVSEISATIKGVAKDLRIPIIALAQLNRGVEHRADQRPVLSDLRESGSLEQDADIVMFIHRDKSEDNGNFQVAEVIFSKNRNGPTGVVELGWLGKHTSFEDLDRNGPQQETQYEQ